MRGCDTGVLITEDVHLDSDQHEAAEVSQQNMTIEEETPKPKRVKQVHLSRAWIAWEF